MTALRIAPCFPAVWEEAEATRHFRGADYHIVIRNPKAPGKGQNRSSRWTAASAMEVRVTAARVGMNGVMTVCTPTVWFRLSGTGKNP